MSVTDQSPDSAPFPPLPQRRPASANGDGAAGQAPSSQPLPRRFPEAAGSSPESGLPKRFPGGSDSGPGASLPRRNSGGRPRRVGRHRSLHRISVASDAPALVLAVPGRGDSAAELARHVAETAAESCPGVDHAPQAVVVPLLAGPHPAIDQAVAAVIASARASVMLAAALGPHPLLAGALHDRLYEVGLARANRARGLNIAAGAPGILVVADRGPQAISDAGVTTVLLASRLAIPAVPASLGDRASIDAAVQRLREAGATQLAIAPCVIGPETDPEEFAALSAALGAPCSAPLGGHPAVAQLVAVRYGEALARIAVASH